MAPTKKKGPQEKMEARNTLTAIVLADSFTQRFRPITVETPKALLPLVNVPMIEYTLEWLAMNKVEEIFVFCCAHADKVQAYLAESKWAQPGAAAGGSGSSGAAAGNSYGSPTVHVIMSTVCLSAGEALRSIYQRDLIKSDFVLVSADTISNMDLAPALAAHNARRAVDKNAIMTMVMKPIRHPLQRLRLGDVELVVSLDSTSGRLLKYSELDPQRPGGTVKLDAALFSERDCVKVRSDLMDTHIAICSSEVLMLFADNFDYQNVKRDFVTGVLSEEELGNKLYVHELTHEYAARIHNLRSYDAVSRDILQRWVFPFVPDTNLLRLYGSWGAGSYRYNRGQRYCELQVTLARHACIGEDVCVGAGTSIADRARISQCVIGRNCRIGAGAELSGCYVQDNVTIQDGAVLRFALVCERAIVRAGAVVEPGCVLSYGVIVAARHRVPPHTHVSLCRQQAGTAHGSDDELEYSAPPTISNSSSRQHSFEKGQLGAGPGGGRGLATAGGQRVNGDADDGSSGDDESSSSSLGGEDPLMASLEKPLPATLRAAEALALGRAPDPGVTFDKAAVGSGGAGYTWNVKEGAPDARYFSIAPPPDAWPQPSASGDAEAEAAEVGGGGRSEKGTVADSDAESDDQELDPESSWKQEVEETFLRCIQQRFDPDNVVIELNALKIAEDRTFADCARYMLTTLLGLLLPPPPGTKADYRALYAAAVPPSTKDGQLALLRGFKKLLADWKGLLQRFLRSEDDQVELLLTLEEFCGQENVFENSGQGPPYTEIFAQVLQQLYEADVVTEEAFLAWADEKAQAEADDKAYLVRAQKFIDWLRTADEDEDEDDSEEEDD